MKLENEDMDKSRSRDRVDPSTLAEVIVSIRKLDHPEKKKRRLIQDIQKACRWFGVKPDNFPTCPAQLRSKLWQLSPGGLQVSKKRIANVKGSLKTALQLTGIIEGRAYLAPLTPEWEDVRSSFETRFQKAGLSRAIHYFSSRRISPHSLTDADLESYLNWLQSEQLVRKPHELWRRTIKAFNELQANGVMHFRKLLNLPKFTDFYILPIATFDPGLIEDIERFLSKAASDDPFDLDSRIKPLKPSTIATYRDRLLRVASLHVLAGGDAADLRSLADLVQLDVTTRALKHLLTIRDPSPKALAAVLSTTLAVVSSTHVDWPSDELKRANVEALNRTASRLKQRHGIAKKSRLRLIPLKHEPTLAKLFLVPLSLARRLERCKNPDKHDALNAQKCLVLAILSFAALRIGSICSLRIDKHLIWSRPDMKGDLYLQFDEGELKNDEEASIPLPSECAAMVRLYISRFRPLISPPDSPYLFTSTVTGQARRIGPLSRQLTQLIHQRTGLEVNPHLYRHIVHLVILRRFPGAYALISRVLTHTSLETARRNYCEFDVDLSMKAYQELVLEVQSGTSRAKQASSKSVAYDKIQETHYHGK